MKVLSLCRLAPRTAAAHAVGVPAAVRASRSIANALLVTNAPAASTTVRTMSPFASSAHIQQTRPFRATSASRDRVPFLLADIGEGITECEIIQWFVKPGDRIEQFSRICEVQSDKAAVEITSRYDGVVHKLLYNIGDMAKVGAPLIEIETDGSDDASAAAAEPTPSSSESPAKAAEPIAAAVKAETTETDFSEKNSLVLATPAVRRVAKENKVDLGLVQGTGKGGRIMKEDVLAFITGGGKKAQPSPAAPAKPVVAAADKIVPPTGIQKAMFKQMTKSLAIPHFGFADEITMTAASQFRSSINAYLASSGAYSFKKISYMPIFIKAASLALNEFPILNACIVNGEDPAKAQLQYRASHNIGIAMDTPNGLIVPNIKNVESKSILEIAAEIERLKESGKKGAISPSDLSGGTFTLSNIGTVGGTYLHPVLVTSEVCIGAIGKLQRLPRFETVVDPETGKKVEKVVAQELVAVSWNADHRVIDGATMARFVKLWKEYIENPALIAAQTK